MCNTLGKREGRRRRKSGRRRRRRRGSRSSRIIQAQRAARLGQTASSWAMTAKMRSACMAGAMQGC
jgi:hypothetical protein